jgi:4-amino-4-deoxy-L-arabinose transferase-like glycosyltransferase
MFGMKKLLFFAFVFSFIIYFLTSAGKTPYDYFTRLSDSFLQGKTYLIQNPPWLSELIPAGSNKYYVVYPPMPAILAMPFRFIFGENFQQQYLAHLLGAGVVILTMLIAYTIKRDKKLIIWAGLLAGFGNIIWFLSSVGSSWYLSQIAAAFFLTAAILECLNKKPPLLVGLLFGAAFLSRIEVFLLFPVFLYFLWGRDWVKNYFKLALGFLPFILLNFSYNYTRFGVVWDKAYILIPGLLQEPWYQNGVLNIKNIPNHLKIIFTSLPLISRSPPFIRPSWAGLAIWITTPAFLYAFFAKIKEKVVKFSWLSILLISLFIFSHGTTGFTQFGYRFAVDFYPILLFLTIKGVARTGLKWHHWLLLFVSVLVNTWGVLWINKFGWVSF